MKVFFCLRGGDLYFKKKKKIQHKTKASFWLWGVIQFSFQRIIVTQANVTFGYEGRLITLKGICLIISKQKF